MKIQSTLHAAKSVMFLPTLALLSLMGCTTSTTPSDTGVVLDGGDDVLVDTDATPRSDVVFFGEVSQCDGGTRIPDGGFLGTYVYSGPDEDAGGSTSQDQCYRTIAPYFGYLCIQPGFLCGIGGASGGATCTTQCPPVWQRTSAGGR